MFRMTLDADAAAAFVSKIESLGTRVMTPCAAGSLIWRIWGEGSPLVLLHGASGSWTHWIRNVRALATRFRVLVPDMPGFGDSDAPLEPHTADGLAELVASGLDVILPPPTKLDLAGFSFGGIIGGLVAARLKGRIRTLVLLGTGGLALPRAATRPLLRIQPGMTLDESGRVHRENLRTLMIASSDKVDDLAIFLQIDNLRRTRFKSGDIPQSDTLLKALPAIQARITGIWGRHDAFAGPNLEECRRILASAQQDLDFRVIEGAGHWTPYEAADQVNAILCDMLGESLRERACPCSQ
jgi:2-hydroxy-6-oxonona-2,4-dienedioate hydrolase